MIRYTNPFVRSVLEFAATHTLGDTVARFNVPKTTVHRWCAQNGVTCAAPPSHREAIALALANGHTSAKAIARAANTTDTTARKHLKLLPTTQTKHPHPAPREWKAA